MTKKNMFVFSVDWPKQSQLMEDEDLKSLVDMFYSGEGQDLQLHKMIVDICRAAKDEKSNQY